MRTECGQCGKIVKFQTNNCYVNIYPSQPWLSWIAFYCGKCSQESRQFFGPDRWQETIQEAMEKDLGIIMDEPFAPDTTVDNFERVYGLTRLTPQDLTPRQETHIAFFRYLLDQGEVL